MRNIFKPKKAKASSNLPAETLVSATLVDAIWRLTTLPREEFAITYGSFFTACSDLLLMAKASGFAIEEKPLDQVLTEIKRALQIKKGLLFPRGIETDDAVYMAEAFSFAVTTALGIQTVAAVLDNKAAMSGNAVWMPFRSTEPMRNGLMNARANVSGVELLYVNRLINEEGMSWLYQYEPVFNHWVLFFSDPVQSEVFQLLKLSEIKTADKTSYKTELKSNENGVEKTDKAPKEDKIVPPTAPPVSSNNPTNEMSKGAVFMHWMATAVAEKSLSMNEDDSLVHVTKDYGLYIVTPGIFEAYEKATKIPARTAQNQFQRLKINRIKKDKTNIYLAKVSGKKVGGMIISELPDGFEKVSETSEVLEL